MTVFLPRVEQNNSLGALPRGPVEYAWGALPPGPLVGSAAAPQTAMNLGKLQLPNSQPSRAVAGTSCAALGGRQSCLRQNLKGGDP